MTYHSCRIEQCIVLFVSVKDQCLNLRRIERRVIRESKCEDEVAGLKALRERVRAG